MYFESVFYQIIFVGYLTHFKSHENFMHIIVRQVELKFLVYGLTW